MARLEVSRAQRLDQKVVELLPQVSRAFAAKLIESGKVAVNGAAEGRPGYKLRLNDTVNVDYDLAELQQVPDIELPILYEDSDCVVIDKPIGVLAHSKGAFNPEATVATWLRSRLAAGLSGERAGIVHRLDRATSGVMILAKTPDALSWLQKQFSMRKVRKVYFAVVSGRMPHEHAIIDMPIERNPKKPQTFRVGSNGKAAITEYWVRGEGNGMSLVELRPQTGRTHQLRVHLREIGHPIVGDPLYGNKPAGRLYLHAEQLEITLPSRARQTFIAPLPAIFSEKVKA
jgi:23S rRNA pseudouridine1911/1915/1917 synthase